MKRNPFAAPPPAVVKNDVNGTGTIMENGNQKNSPCTVNQNSETFSRRELMVLLIVAALSVVVLDLLFFGHTLDDALITFRYSKHLAQGFGFGAWNTSGERVEGYSSFLWMTTLALAYWAGIPIWTAAKVFSLLAHLALCSFLILSPLLPQRPAAEKYFPLNHPTVPVLAGLFLAWFLPLSFYAGSGMETAVFVCILGIQLFAHPLRLHRWLVPAMGALLILTRPEGPLFAGTALLYDAWQRRRAGEALRPAYLHALLLAAAFFGLLAQRWVLYHDVVPNTYWAKVGGSSWWHARLGAYYVADWVRNNVALEMLAIVGAASVLFVPRRNGRRDGLTTIVFILLPLLIYVLHLVKAGGDAYTAFPQFRFFVQVMPYIVLLAAFGITRVSPPRRHFHLVLLVALAALTNGSLLSIRNGQLADRLRQSAKLFPVIFEPKPFSYLFWLRSISDKNTTIASTLGGQIPYYVDAVHIDSFGLNTPYIARHGSFEPHGRNDSKSDMKWVMEQRPDILEGYISAWAMLYGDTARVEKIINGTNRKMNLDTLTSPIFQQEYCFVRNGPYDNIDRAFFINRKYLARQPRMKNLDCVPVSATALSIYRDRKVDAER